MSRLLNDPDKFLPDLEARIRQYIQRIHAGDVDRRFVALDLINAIFSGYNGGLTAADISSAYPKQAWKDDQLLIPRALLHAIAESWTEYEQGGGDVTLDQAFRATGLSTGKSGSARRTATLDREIKLSNAVVFTLIEAEEAGAKISQDAAIALVCERENANRRADSKTLKYETVRKAFQKHGRSALAAVRAARPVR